MINVEHHPRGDADPYHTHSGSKQRGDSLYSLPFDTRAHRMDLFGKQYQSYNQIYHRRIGENASALETVTLHSKKE